MALRAILATVLTSFVIDRPVDRDSDVRSPLPTPHALPSSLIGNRRGDLNLDRSVPQATASSQTTLRDETDKSLKPIKSRIGAALGRVSSPITRWLHGEVGVPDERKSREIGNPDLAKSKRFSPEVEAINYLASLDSNSYPEIVDSLLVSLDDASAQVRLAVLQSLYRKCQDRQHTCGRDGKGNGPFASTCPGCRACRKVVTRLEGLLLDSDERGALKERSLDNRELAVKIIIALDSPDSAKAEEIEFTADQVFVPDVKEPVADGKPGPGALAPSLLPRPEAPQPQAPRPKSKWFRWFDGNSDNAAQPAVKAGTP